MKKAQHSSLIVILTFCLFLKCAPSFDDCYTCEKESGGYWSSIGYVATFKTTLACSDEAAENLEIDGWDCIGYNKSTNTVKPGKPGKRIIALLTPSNEAVYVDLNVSLSWSNKINWYDKEMESLAGVTFDIYLDTETHPVTVVSKNQTSLIFNMTLVTNTTYYWKVIAKNDKGESSESAIWRFKTRPNITLGTFTDTRDGHVYKTVSNGDQVWMAENLAYKIPGKEVTDDAAWYKRFHDPATNTFRIFDAWCYYENDKDSIGNIYGVLYQWEAAKVACPTGWHLPSNTEWNYLFSGLSGGGSFAGGKLKEIGTTHWISPNSGASNLTCFTALPGGWRDYIGKFEFIGSIGSWWTSTEDYYIDDAIEVGMNSSGDGVFSDKRNKNYGLSVRCLKN